jgi:DNA-binding NarL/FixJ family response regulator
MTGPSPGNASSAQRESFPRTRAAVTVLLVDDHAVVREGYRRLLEEHGDITVVGEAAHAAEAHGRFISLEPQVVVMDIKLPDVSGLQAMRRMLGVAPGTRVLIFSMYEDAVFARSALQAGAFGYVTKASAPKVLVEAVHAVASGRRYLSADVAQDLALRAAGVGAGGGAGEDDDSGLSARELEVLRLLVQGRSVRDIARLIGLSPKTVANHQSAIKQKLGADTALQMLTKAAKLGLNC